MVLYRYAQTEEKGKWLPVAVTKHYEEEIRKLDATRVSVLAVSQILDDDTKPDELSYIGPLYFDIDLAGNINLAISSAQELVHKLRELEVPDEGIQVFCSGQKGFHVFVPETVFFPGTRPIKRLPYIYMEMAKDLYVMGLDFAVYSGGRGRLFRPENALRPDGKYRVRISLAELDVMTPEMYAELTSKPRQVNYPGPNGHTSHSLSSMFERARKRSTATIRMHGTPLPLEQLVPYAEEPPACIDLLTKYEITKGANFNSAGLQLAAFIARAGVPDYKAESLIALMAEAAESATYNNPMKRTVHLRGLMSYTNNNPRISFSCSAMRSVVGSSQCKNCPLDNKALTDSTEVDEDGAVLGVVAQQEGYYLKKERGEARLTTFTMHPTEVYMDESQGGHSSRRSTTVMEVHSKGATLGTVTFDETGWRSKAEFLKQLEGLNSITFLGGDTDVQRLKFAVYRHNEEDEVDEVTNVYTAGIHAGTVGRKKVYTYVEPGLSINSFGIQGTHRFQGRLTAAPEIRKSPKPEPGGVLLREAITSLFKANHPQVVSQLLGWHSAAHLKMHISDMFKQFPILNLWGEAGSGKTFTSALFAYLNGVDYRSGGSPLSLSTSTAFPIVETCSSTTTIPRLLEEFNESQMRSRGGIYQFATDVLKAAWDGMAVPRGSLSRTRADSQGRVGAHIEQLYITSPLVVCCEQAPQKPALQQRSIQVQVSRQMRLGCTPAFERALELKAQLLIMARALTMMAVRTKDEWVVEQYKEANKLLPPGLFDRNKFSYATLLVGLSYFNAVAASLNLGVEENIAELKQHLIGTLGATADTLLKAKTWSEVDIFLTSIGEMAQLALQNNALSSLVPGKNFAYLADQDELVLDLRIIFPLYRQYAARMGQPVVFSSLAQLEPLLKSEKYFLTDGRVVPQMTGVRKLWALDTIEMMNKGHQIELFVQ